MLLALCCVLVLPCILSVVFSVVLFLQAFSVLLHPFLQCVHSAALVANVYPLARVSGLLITRAAWQYFAVWLAERCRGGFCMHLRSPSLPSHYYYCYYYYFGHSLISMVFFITIIAIIIWL